MTKGNFYFIEEKYYIDFPDEKLMKNHEIINGKNHDRPCFYAFREENTGLIWLIPVSSQVEKYRKYQQDKIKKYGSCDTILFGDVLGHEKAFLIQNICPITERYIKNEYIDVKNNIPVRVDGVFEKVLLSKAKKVLALERKGIRVVFPNILKIEQELLMNNK